MGKLYPIGSLWINKSKKTGEQFFSGTVSKQSVLIFKNKDKFNEKSVPDYIVMSEVPFLSDKNLLIPKEEINEEKLIEDNKQL
jgi:hypothetical protein